MIAAWIAAVSAAVISLMSAFLTYNTTRRLSRRSDQIAFVGRQLSELYGPLYALAKASSISWAEFMRKQGGGRGYLFDSRTRQDDDLVREWTYWLRNVFMPINRKMLDALLSKADLIDDIEMPQCLIDFCAHVTGYEVTLAKWEDKDFSVVGSIINHPGSSFQDYVEGKYKELKVRQASLLQSKSQLRQLGCFTANTLVRGRRTCTLSEPSLTINPVEASAPSIWPGMTLRPRRAPGHTGWATPIGLAHSLRGP